VMTSRIPGHLQDHAFCFECGIFFQLSRDRAAQCDRCGSSFVQFLRGQSHQHWISAHSDTGMSYAFDDQLDSSINASMEEQPAYRKPTQAGFLKGLPTVTLEAAQVETRASYGEADPRCTCSICREVFNVGDTLRQMPCSLSHEFHDTCIITWLQSNNTCPICRWRCPEAQEGEEEEEEDCDLLRLKQQDSPPECSGERQGLPSTAEAEDEGDPEEPQGGGNAAVPLEASDPA